MAGVLAKLTVGVGEGGVIALPDPPRPILLASLLPPRTVSVFLQRHQVCYFIHKNIYIF
jgi:hypothetical protein